MKCPHNQEINILVNNAIVYYLHKGDSSSCELLNRLDVQIEEIIGTYTDNVTAKSLTPIVRVSLIASEEYRFKKWFPLLTTKDPNELRTYLLFLEDALLFVSNEEKNKILSEGYSFFRDNFLINWEIISYDGNNYPNYAYIAESANLNTKTLPMINLKEDSVDSLTKEFSDSQKKKQRNVFAKLDEINKSVGKI